MARTVHDTEALCQSRTGYAWVARARHRHCIVRSMRRPGIPQKAPAVLLDKAARYPRSHTSLRQCGVRTKRTKPLRGPPPTHTSVGISGVGIRLSPSRAGRRGAGASSTPRYAWGIGPNRQAPMKIGRDADRVARWRLRGAPYTHRNAPCSKDRRRTGRPWEMGRPAVFAKEQRPA